MQTQTHSPRKLGSVLGVPLIVQPIAGLPGFVITVLAFLLYRRLGRGHSAWLLALWSGLSWYDADITHAVGHIVSARLAGAPMSTVDFSILARTLYDDNQVAPIQHIGRAVGGPIASGITATLWWLLWRSLPNGFLRDLAGVGLLMHGLIAVGSLAPLPFLDGGVIIENLRKL